MKTMQKLFLIVTMCLSLTGMAFAAEYNWTFQSSAQAGDDAYRFEKMWSTWLEADSKGRIKVEVLPTNSIVQYSETMDAVGANIIQGEFTDPSYFAGKDPAFSLIGNMVGAWSHPYELFDFMDNGGGYEIFDGLLGQYGVKLLGVASTGTEAFVSKKPIYGIADLKGIKLRAPQGMVNDVFSAVGAAPVNLPGSEVYTALEKGVIDAADYTVFATNHAQGLHDIARYPIYPGFHSMPTMQVTLNLSVWNSLPKDLQVIVLSTVKRFSKYMVEEGDKLDKAAVVAAKAAGIEVITWDKVEVAKFRKIAQGQWAKWSTSPTAKTFSKAVSAYWKSKGMM